MSRENPTHSRAAAVAQKHLPYYLSTWIAGTLFETHTLLPLIEHQNRIAADIIDMEGMILPAPNTELLLTPAEHLRRGRELIKQGEDDLSRGGQDVGDLAQLARAHFAAAAEIDRQAERQMDDVKAV